MFLFHRQPFSFVTSDVVEATCQCLLAQAEDAESHKLSQEDTEGMIIGEFGRCLKQVCLGKSNCLFNGINQGTILQSLMNAKLSQHRFRHCHENGLKTIQTIPHNL